MSAVLLGRGFGCCDSPVPLGIYPQIQSLTMGSVWDYETALRRLRP